jgi:hypothetical protein
MSTDNTYQFDNAQMHMLGLIVSIMNNYGLQTIDIESYQINQSEASLHATADVFIDNKDDLIIESVLVETNRGETPPLISNKDYSWTTPNTVKHSWASDSGESDNNDTSESGTTPDKKIYVAHRRAFRDAISNGIKICSHYKDCSDEQCLRFHVLDENLCTHAGRNNYCDQSNCDKIVIKACRKGRRCTDTSCSFRH